tara:strand:+ start:1666 stop:2148 length:483 start_codon:yes stop_codon:yes gene_type:complete
MAQGNGGGFLVLGVIAAFAIFSVGSGALSNPFDALLSQINPEKPDEYPNQNSTMVPDSFEDITEIKELNPMTNSRCSNLPPDRVYSFTTPEAAIAVSQDMGLDGEIHEHPGPTMILAGFFDDGSPDYRSSMGPVYMPGMTHEIFVDWFNTTCNGNLNYAG